MSCATAVVHAVATRYAACWSKYNKNLVARGIRPNKKN